MIGINKTTETDETPLQLALVTDIDRGTKPLALAPKTPPISLVRRAKWWKIETTAGGPGGQHHPAPDGTKKNPAAAHRLTETEPHAASPRPP